MSNTAIINLGSGDLTHGFPNVTARLWTEHRPRAEQFVGSLPPATELDQSYRIWQSIYRALCSRLTLRSPTFQETDDELEIEEGGITQVSQQSFQDFSQQLQQRVNSWLKSEGFLNIERQLRSALKSSASSSGAAPLTLSQLDPDAEIRVIFEVDDDLLRRLPWHCWDFFQDYPNAEMALSRPEYKRRKLLELEKPKKKVRILAILGDCGGIDIETERQFLQSLPDAETMFLVTPSRQEFNHQLWDDEGWDILFFAGHSQTEEETGRIYINENPFNNSLTVEQLEEALNTAIDNGLKLAIFNSCDGVGLAQALGKLHIPQVIVMREPVSNQVAQEFLRYFLEAFARERLPLYLAVRQARRKLQGLEDDFPGASWLPVICQNPVIEPSTWLRLGGMPPCPYRGLSAFEEEDAHLFFGREQFTDGLVAAVKRKALVAVVGSSGSGKSSVVFAGLVPLLRKAQNSIRWQIISFRPGLKPFEALAEVLAKLIAEVKLAPPGPNPLLQDDDQDSRFRVLNLQVELQHDRQALCKVVESLIQQNPGTRLLLIADQFEELYTLCPEQDRQPFLDGLLNAVQYAPGFTLMLTLRADFYGYALSERRFSDALQGAVYNLGPMSREELQTAIAQPAAQMQVKLEKGLTNQLIQAMEGHAGRLPLLEFTLTQLWSKQQAGWLTHQAYNEIGGVEEAIANHAEMVYAQLAEPDRQRVQRIFVQLVEPGAGIEPSRRLATRDEVGEANWDLVMQLASSRLMVTNRNPATGEETVEIVHEALIRSWGRLEQWIQANSEFRRWQEDLRRARRQWESSDRDREALWRGKLLSDAEYWSINHRVDLTDKEQQFIQLSLQQRDRVIQQRKHRRQLLFSSLVVGLLCTLLLTSATWWQSQCSILSEMRALSTSSEALFASNQRLDSFVDALRSWRLRHKVVWVDRETRDRTQLALQQAIFQANEQNRLSGHEGTVYGVAYSPDGRLIATASNDTTVKLWQPDGKLIKTLSEHKSGVYGVRFSPDGQILATTDIDGNVKLWNRDGSLRSFFKASGVAVYIAAFRSDGRMIATASNDGTVRLWTQNGTSLRDIKTLSGNVYDVAFSPDGQLIATAGADKIVKLWKPDGTLIKSLTGHTGTINRIAFSPDGQLIASAGEDKTIKLWKQDGTLLRTLEGHTGRINGIAFSRDSQTIASASGDGSVKLWRRDGTLVDTFSGRNGEVWSVAFSPDGQTIASASSNRTVQLWKRDKALLTTLNGHQGRVNSVVFSPDGQLIASAGEDKRIILWRSDGTRLETLTGNAEEIRAVAFSADGQLIASASDDRTVRLWKRDGSPVKVLPGHEGTVYSVAFSPDGQLIASGSTMGTIALWKPDGTLWKMLHAHRDDVWGVAFSPNGQIIASASRDRTIKLSKRDGTLLKTLADHQAEVSAVAFSPDGQQIASASWDRTVKLWNRDGTLLKTLTGHSDRVQNVAFSSDGQLIASASDDRTIKLWKKDGTLLNTLKGHDKVVLGVAFSPDNRTLASASADKTVILWNLQQVSDVGQVLAEGCKWVGNYLRTNAELTESDRHLCDDVEHQNN